MVFAEYLHPGCYSQLYMIESKMKSLKCGIYEGIYWSILISIFIIVMVLRMLIIDKKPEMDETKIKNYTIIIIFIIFVTLITFYSIGYVNKWNSFQELIEKYKKQGLRDYEIFYIFEMELGRNAAPYLTAISAGSGLLFKRGKDEKENNTKKENVQ
uniref:Uncharacterized protein n=1 Tax=viral metagenome TaxID=1070528 RepID=A0A6C0I724_9ZZZZ